MKVKIPDDKFVKLVIEMNRAYNPNWERKLRRWAKKNKIKLQGV